MKLRKPILSATLVAVSAMLICSCRSTPFRSASHEKPQATSPAGYAPENQQSPIVLTEYIQSQPGLGCENENVSPSQMPQQMMPQAACQTTGCDGGGSWAPDGVARPWPDDEYLVDGGDRNLPVEVAPDWKVYGLESEDTVAHFDTLDGRTMVESSNQVCVYAPRFGAVRKVTSLVAEHHVASPGGISTPEQLAYDRSKQEVWHGEKFVQLGSQKAQRPPIIFENKQGDGAISTKTNLQGASHSVLSYENLTMVKHGQLDNNESALLARGVAAAIVWSQFEQVQVVLDGVTAVEFAKTDKPFAIYTVDEKPSRPKLRLCKLASTASAKPSEEIEFTLRFDNTGNEPIGNIVLLDNLTARLEYVENSTDTTLQADFSVEPNDSGSTVLRWELKDALDVAQGGVIRFKCRVR